MNKIASTFSFREFLTIVIPGLYLAAILSAIVQDLGIMDRLVIKSTEYTIVFLVVAVLLGLIFYGIDMAKELWFFKEAAPIPRFIKKFSLQEEEGKVKGAYYRFYDEVSQEQKAKTEVYTSLYHLCINLALACVIIFIISGIAAWIMYASPLYFFLNLFLLILSVINAMLIFRKRVKDMFDRQYNGFLASDYSKDLRGVKES